MNRRSFSGGLGAARSRGRRVAMPNPVNRVSPSAQCTRIFAGFKSLCTRRRSWTLASAAAIPMAERKKRSASMGAPTSRSSGSPPGFASSNIKQSPWRKSWIGRADQPESSWSTVRIHGQAIKDYGRWTLRGGHYNKDRAAFAFVVLAPTSPNHPLGVVPRDLEVAKPANNRLKGWIQTPPPELFRLCQFAVETHQTQPRGPTLAISAEKLVRRLRTARPRL